MKAIKTIRCSSLPTAFDCPPALQPIDVEIDPLSPPADQGSAAHEVMSVIVETDARSIDGIEIVAIAEKWKADADELQIQAFVGLGVWQQLRDRFPVAQAEVELAQSFDIDGTVVELTGHVDALSVSGRVATVGDWKFGRVDKNHAHQVRGYMALVLATYPDVEKVLGFVGWMVDREIENYSMTRDQLWKWLDELKREVINAGPTFHPGQQCTYCRRNHQCQAMTAMARRDVLVLGDPGMSDRITNGLSDLADVELISLYRRSRVISRLIDNLDEAVKRRVDAAGGRLPDGDGRELRFVDSLRRVIDPIKALPVLEQVLTAEELASCTVLRPSKIDDAISAKTLRGGKKKAIEDLTAQLRAADAITEEATRRLTDVRSKEG